MNIAGKLSDTWQMVQEWAPMDQRVVLAMAVVLGTGTVGKLVHCIFLRYKLSQLRKQKKQHCKLAFEELASRLTRAPQLDLQQKAEILALPFAELKAFLKSGKFTPLQVLQAFQSEALDVHDKTNCLEEPFLEAQNPQQYLAVGGTGYIIPKSLALDLQTQDRQDLPLYGIPVSIKDGYGVEGYDCIIGVARMVGKPFSEDCVIVKVLKEQGAIPYVRTNVPQLMLAYETSNPIHGLTTHPLNKKRGVGGSSGGEGALLAAGGSVLGFGSDIGGSVRIPAAFCGVCAMKPTQCRLSDKGMVPLLEGQTFIKVDFGPMAREVDALVEAFRALMSPLMFKLDPALPPLTFNEQMFGSTGRLRVGYYVFDGVMHAVPACERAAREAVQQLQALGHEVVEWDFAKYGQKLTVHLFGTIQGDGGKEIQDLMVGDKIDPSMKFIMWTMNRLVNRVLAATVGIVYPFMGSILRAGRGRKTVSDWWNLGADLKSIREEVFDDWQNLGLDVVVSPGFCTPALPHELPGQTPVAVSGTGVYNALHCPVGALPVSSVRKEDIDKMDSYPTPDPWHKLIKEAQMGSEGLPVGVQVAALPWHDELCLRVMKELETALKH